MIEERAGELLALVDAALAADRAQGRDQVVADDLFYLRAPPDIEGEQTWHLRRCAGVCAN